MQVCKIENNEFRESPSVALFQLLMAGHLELKASANQTTSVTAAEKILFDA